MTNSQLTAPAPVFTAPAFTAPVFTAPAFTAAAPAFSAPAPVIVSTFTAPAAALDAAFLAPDIDAAVAAIAPAFVAPDPATAAAVVPGMSQTGVELTLVMSVSGPAATVRHVIERLSEALYAQCISFEVVGIADSRTLDADEVNGLPLTRFVRADEADIDAALWSDSPLTTGDWMAVLDVEAAAQIDAYGFVELLHQARERNAAGN
ncbi:hypothetical protein [Actinoplanes subglobosus]|uniref:Uncharacterized protein n=1 Tax=Actinoplanes subglobosus TaxID=1547892 RepID=A0ABV8IQP5_9ACTN